MNPTAIYSKTGKGMQETSGKTSRLSRADRAVLSAIDGRTTVRDLNLKFDKIPEAKFVALIEQMDKDGFIREASPGVAPVQAKAPARPAPAAPKGKGPSADPGEELDFTAFSSPPKPAAAPPPQVDLAAKARADAERRAKEEEAISYKARAEVEAKAKAEAEARARAEREAKMRAEAEAKQRAEAEAKARAESEARVRAEADAKVKAARDAAMRLAAEAKAKAEAEAQAKIEVERKAREEVERKAREEAERVRQEAEQRAREAEEKARRETEELRRQLEEERKQLEEERKRREEEDRKRREEEERARKEAEERRRREDEERRKREEEERKKREAEEKARRQAEERARREEEELRKREEAERRKREEEERARRETEERARREEEERRRKDEERTRREEEERRRKDEERTKREEQERARKEQEKARKEAEERARREADERRRKDEERRKREEEETARREADERRRRDEEERARREEQAKPGAAAGGGGFADSLLADLDSFAKRDEEEQKAQAEAERKAKEDAARKAKEEEERRAREEKERERREEQERRAREEEERRAREEEERQSREEEERRKREEQERKRRAKETLAAKMAEQAPLDDIGVSDADLDMDDVRRDEQALSVEARRAARAREREEQRRDREGPVPAAAPAKPRKPVKWGKPAAIGLLVLLVAAVGVVHVMPVSTADYEKAASDALGQPVKIASGRLSLLTGVRLGFERVTVGGAVTIDSVRAFPEVGSLFSEKKAFSRIELEGASIPQQALGDALLGAFRGESLKVGRVVAKNLKLDGPVKLPALEADAAVASDGTLKSVTLRGPDNLLGRLAPKGNDIEFEVTAGSFALPVAPEVSLSQFGMKGTATRDGMRITSWDGTKLDGVVKGSANLSWGAAWKAQGELRVTGLNAAVFAPALLSEGKAEGSGRFTFSGADPAKLAASGRIEGNFTIAKGVLGSFDLSRAIQTQGSQASGRTQFAELTAQGVYDNGAVSLKNVTISAGALNAGVSLDVTPAGALSGRIVADVKTQAQTLRATLSVAGTVKEPQVRK